MTDNELIHQLDTNPSSTQPAANTGIAVGVLGSVWFIINSIWPGLVNENLQDSINHVLIIVVPVIVGFLIRRKVWSPASVNQVVNAVKARTFNRDI